MFILRKTLVAITGLFICIFLIAHLGANFILLLPPSIAHDAYNNYSAFLRGNPLVTVIAYVNYVCILAHIVLAIYLTAKSKTTRQKQYAKFSGTEVSSWSSQNMALLGSVVFAFIVLHMAQFWFKVKILGQEHDLYLMVVELFNNPIYVIIYTLAMLPIAMHLHHGVKSAFMSMGLYHKKYLRWVAKAAVVYSYIIGFGFAVIPVVVFIR
ncbi:succinate dehydrogenase cytochrome b subunit [Bdellovibrio sp. HCB209]|uniref:succinate dehydrogenase cytochrome b subunit n=1 Tax=Bdellovibrio sp. HCB209 TaxID=3394354 RepID=UPI0039B4BE0B